MSDETIDFFKQKRPWSKYKDLILDYYLRPYLAKVVRIGRPVLLVDCFAGAGRYEDGSEGSPVIMARHAGECRTGKVDCVFIEAAPELAARLTCALRGSAIKADVRQGDFHDHVEWIAEQARTHTVFLYLDPIKPSQLLFDDMAATYDRIRTGQSIEVLANFLSPSFLRQAKGLLKNLSFPLIADTAEQEQVLLCNRILGGVDWQNICSDPSLSTAQRVDALARTYADRLGRWFRFVLYYPIREKYQHKLPKYHLMFGTRSPDAVDLMNRAMVKARREFVGSQFVQGNLFENQPAEEIVDSAEVLRDVVEVSRRIGRTKWRMLRVETTIMHPCKFYDTEINAAIKSAIQQGCLASDDSGRRVKEDAQVWPVPG